MIWLFLIIKNKYFIYTIQIVFLFVEFRGRNIIARHTAHCLRDGKLIFAPNEFQSNPDAIIHILNDKGYPDKQHFVRKASCARCANASWSQCLSHFHISFLTAGTTLSPINVCTRWRASNLFFGCRRFMVAPHIYYMHDIANARHRRVHATSYLTQLTTAAPLLAATIAH